MTRLRTRLNRLEAQRGDDSGAGPSVILIAEAGGETHAALFRGGSGASRLDGETEAAFIARIAEMVT